MHCDVFLPVESSSGPRTCRHPARTPVWFLNWPKLLAQVLWDQSLSALRPSRLPCACVSLSCGNNKSDNLSQQQRLRQPSVTKRTVEPYFGRGAASKIAHHFLTLARRHTPPASVRGPFQTFNPVSSLFDETCDQTRNLVSYPPLYRVGLTLARYSELSISGK